MAKAHVDECFKEECVANDYWFFWNKPKNENETCAICKNILRDPVKCDDCLTNFCRTCLENYKKKNEGRKFSNNDNCKHPSFKPNKELLNDFLLKLKMRCPLCKEEYDYSTIEQHYLYICKESKAFLKDDKKYFTRSNTKQKEENTEPQTLKIFPPIFPKEILNQTPSKKEMEKPKEEEIEEEEEAQLILDEGEEHSREKLEDDNQGLRHKIDKMKGKNKKLSHIICKIQKMATSALLDLKKQEEIPHLKAFISGCLKELNRVNEKMFELEKRLNDEERKVNKEELQRIQEESKKKYQELLKIKNIREDEKEKAEIQLSKLRGTIDGIEEKYKKTMDELIQLQDANILAEKERDTAQNGYKTFVEESKKCLERLDKKIKAAFKESQSKLPKSSEATMPMNDVSQKFQELEKKINSELYYVISYIDSRTSNDLNGSLGDLLKHKREREPLDE